MCRINPRIGGRFGWGELKSACILIKSAVSDKRGVGWNVMGQSALQDFALGSQFNASFLNGSSAK